MYLTSYFFSLTSECVLLSWACFVSVLVSLPLGATDSLFMAFSSHDHLSVLKESEPTTPFCIGKTFLYCHNLKRNVPK